jgi:hypothetical protein
MAPREAVVGVRDSVTKLVKRKSSRRRRKHVDPYKDDRFVVVKVKTGYMKPGVYKRRVSIDGEIAFIHPREGLAKATMMPASHVFDVKEKADAFFTADAEVQWVVQKADDDDETPDIFQAKIRSYINKRSYDRWSREVEVIARVDGKPVSSRWGTHAFKTEREALRYMLSYVSSGIEEADAKVRQIQSRREGFLKIQRRIKQLGIKRAMKAD